MPAHVLDPCLIANQKNCIICARNRGQALHIDLFISTCSISSGILQQLEGLFFLTILECEPKSDSIICYWKQKHNSRENSLQGIIFKIVIYMCVYVYVTDSKGNGLLVISIWLTKKKTVKLSFNLKMNYQNN